MKTLEMNQMEGIEGGGVCANTKKVRADIAAATFLVATFGGFIGAAIAGPSAAGIIVADLVCAYK